MTIYTVSETKNKFIIYSDDSLILKRKICLLCISLGFNNDSIPEVVNVHCSEIDTRQRLLNGKRSDMLIQIIDEKKNNISYNPVHKQFIELISKDCITSLTFSFTGEDGVLLDNLKSVKMDLEVI